LGRLLFAATVFIIFFIRFFISDGFSLTQIQKTVTKTLTFSTEKAAAKSRRKFPAALCPEKSPQRFAISTYAGDRNRRKFIFVRRKFTFLAAFHAFSVAFGRRKFPKSL
jgi:hypothetical protein